MTTSARGPRIWVGGLVALAVLGAAWPLHAQTVTITPDRTSLTMDDELVLEVRASGEFVDLTPPATPGFDVTATGQSSHITMFGAQVTREQVVTMQLTPTAPGRHVIGPAVARLAGGRSVRSETVSVTVTETRATAPVSPEVALSLADKAGEPFFIVPELPQRPVYVGEPIPLAFILFVRADVDVQEIRWRREPTLEGFSVEPLERPTGRRRKTVGRHVYIHTVQAQYLITPLAAGEVTVGGGQAQVTAGSFFSARSYNVRVPAVKLDVRPIPTQGRPPGFAPQNLGRFEVATEVAPLEVRAGERVILTARVTGEGTVTTLAEPVFDPIPDAEVQSLPAGAPVHLTKDGGGVRGTRVFQWVIVPQREGELTIPEVRLPHFDPQAGAFAVATAPGATVRVAGQANLPVGTPAAATADAPLVLRDIRGESDLSTRSPRPLHHAPFYLPTLVAALLLVLLVEGVAALRRRRDRDRTKVRARQARKTAERALAAAARNVAHGDTAALYRDVAAALHGYLSDRFDVHAKGRTHEAVIRLLQDVGVAPELARAVVTELENCDFGRFAPVAMRDEEVRRSLARVQKLLGELDQVTRVAPKVAPTPDTAPAGRLAP